MALDPITSLLNIGNTLIDRLLPDKQARDAAKAQLIQMQLQGQLNEIAAQIDVDTQEASNVGHAPKTHEGIMGINHIINVESPNPDRCHACGRGPEYWEIRDYNPAFHDGDIYCRCGRYIRRYDAG